MFTPVEKDRCELFPVKIKMSRRGWLAALVAGTALGGSAAARAAQLRQRLSSTGRRKIPAAHLLECAPICVVIQGVNHRGSKRQRAFLWRTLL